MTTYAYPITLYEYTFSELNDLLKSACEDDKKAGIPTYSSDTGAPISTFANILEIMKVAKESSRMDFDFLAPTVTFTLTDYLFIPLENFLKDKCKQYKERTGNDPFNSLTGEPQHSYASMLEAMRLAIKNMSLNSYSSFTNSDSRFKLWSPKK
jgi:hypothetical protein